MRPSEFIAKVFFVLALMFFWMKYLCVSFVIAGIIMLFVDDNQFKKEKKKWRESI